MVWIEWTAEGERVLRRGRELRVATLARAIAALPPSEGTALAAGLEVLERVLGDV